jgi:hypothetical protein
MTGSDPFSVTSSDLASPEMGHTMNVAIEDVTPNPQKETQIPTDEDFSL